MGNTLANYSEDQVEGYNEQTVFQNLLGSSTYNSQSFYSVGEQPDRQHYASEYEKKLAPIDVNLKNFSKHHIEPAIRSYLLPGESGETIEDSLSKVLEKDMNQHFFVFNLDISSIASIEELSTFFQQLSEMKKTVAEYPAKFAFNIQMSVSIKKLISSLLGASADGEMSFV